MTDAQVEVVGWIAVTFLGLSALLWLVDAAFGIVKTQGQRKILNSAIGVTFLGGIASAAVALLGAEDTPQEDAKPPAFKERGKGTDTRAPSTPDPIETAPPNSQPSGAATPPVSSPQPPTVEPGSDPQPDPAPQPSLQELVSCTLSHPSEIEERANRELGPRPDLDCYKKEEYPRCVADLQRLPTKEVSKLDARDCSKTIEAWRAKYVTPSEQARVPYLPKLNNAERRGRFDTSAQGADWLEHIETEINRMNGTSWDAYNTIVKRSEADMDRCWYEKCKPPEEVERGK